MRSPVAALGVSPNMLWQIRLRWALSVKPASWALVVRLAATAHHFHGTS